MRRFVMLLSLLLPCCLHAQAPITNIAQRQTTSLNGAWASIVDPYETGYYNYRREPYDQQAEVSTGAYFMNHHPRDKVELVEYDFDKSPTLQVPGDWNSQRESLQYYEGTVWLRKVFDYTPRRANNRVFVHFGAVNQRAEVYLNGHKLGAHEGGFTPFGFEITPWLRPSGNFLVVKADNTRRREAVPTTSTDWWNYGGITRDVTLVEEPATYIRDYVVQLKPGVDEVLAGFVALDGAVVDEAVDIDIPELGVHHRVMARQGRAHFELPVSGLQRWSPLAPRLYTVWVSTRHQKLRDDIGFRTVQTRGTDILLNGQPVFLRGISVHEENPLRAARAFSEADALQTLTWAKELGCNYVRLAHYPHNEHILRLADRLGLLVWEEIPVYWTVDFANPATLANARQQLSEAITRDRNRASVVIWSVANETPPSAARNAFLSSLITLTRSLDNTRLVSAALEHHSKAGAVNTQVLDDPIGHELDVVAFNQYIGWYGGTPEDAAAARWEVGFDKPVMVSEFGADALGGLHGDATQRWTEEYQERLYRQTVIMLGKVPQLRGVSPWILVDFRSPRRVLPGIQDGWNRKGLISSSGARKKAFYVLRDYYATMEKQGR